MAHLLLQSDAIGWCTLEKRKCNHTKLLVMVDLFSISGLLWLKRAREVSKTVFEAVSTIILISSTIILNKKSEIREKNKRWISPILCNSHQKMSRYIDGWTLDDVMTLLSVCLGRSCDPGMELTWLSCRVFIHQGLIVAYKEQSWWLFVSPLLSSSVWTPCKPVRK